MLTNPVYIDNYKTPEENYPEKEKNEHITVNMSHKREIKTKKAWQLFPAWSFRRHGERMCAAWRGTELEIFTGRPVTKVAEEFGNQAILP